MKTKTIKEYGESFLETFDNVELIANDNVWFRTPEILLDKDRLMEIIPDTSMSLERIINAVVRLAIGIGIFSILVNRKLGFAIMFVPLIMAASFLFYKSPISKGIGTPSIKSLNKSPNFVGGNISGGNNSKFDVEDFETNLRNELECGRSTCRPLAIDPYGEVCQMPSKDNPVGNVLVSDWSLCPKKYKPCSMEDPKVKAQFDNITNEYLFHDLGDSWKKRFADWHFVSLPGQTIPNDRDAYMKWLYSTPETCKENTASCWPIGGLVA